ncbi:MAG: CCA tRNA nucleotidyltransferase [Candidatus Schekmanbacteria bacterium]|nr:CCA tRNA nucleotidyltransferase [Candidatus Schekmanbacteria bacterium]
MIAEESSAFPVSRVLVGSARAAVATCRQVVAEHGWRLALVGGAVRDLLVGKPPDDVDLVVLAPAGGGADGESTVADYLRSGAVSPRDCQRVAKLVARQLRKPLVELDGLRGTYRIVLAAAPENALKQCTRRVVATQSLDICALQAANLQADLELRDFTMNAMAMVLLDDDTGTLVDPLDGTKDLRDRVVRTSSRERFESDPLRLLRAFRFAAQLSASIADETLQYVAPLSHRIAEPAGERVREELWKLLSRPCAALLGVMERCGLLAALVGAARLDPRGVARVAAVEEEAAATVARRRWLRQRLQCEVAHHLQRLTVAKVCALVWSTPESEVTALAMGRLKSSNRTVNALLECRAAALRALSATCPGHSGDGGPGDDELIWGSYYFDFPTMGVEGLLLACAERPEQATPLRAAMDLFHAVMEARLAAPPLVTGRDLAKLGLRPGPRMGEVMRDLRLGFMQGRVRNVEEATARARLCLSRKGS